MAAACLIAFVGSKGGIPKEGEDIKANAYVHKARECQIKKVARAWGIWPPEGMEARARYILALHAAHLVS